MTDAPTQQPGTAVPFNDPDLADRIFAYVLELLPELGGQPERLAEVQAAVRDEFGGDKGYVRKRTQKVRRSAGSEAVAAEVLRVFNGRNATEVARVLGIGRTTVYRVLKQAGRR